MIIFFKLTFLLIFISSPLQIASGGEKRLVRNLLWRSKKQREFKNNWILFHKAGPQ